MSWCLFACNKLYNNRTTSFGVPYLSYEQNAVVLREIEDTCNAKPKELNFNSRSDEVRLTWEDRHRSDLKVPCSEIRSNL